MNDALFALLGPLIGAGAGSYFGLKSALNGLRERSVHIESVLVEVRDHTRDTKNSLVDHAHDAERYVAELRDEIRTHREN